jgi:hypothetical protein
VDTSFVAILPLFHLQVSICLYFRKSFLHKDLRLLQVSIGRKFFFPGDSYRGVLATPLLRDATAGYRTTGWGGSRNTLQAKELRRVHRAVRCYCPLCRVVTLRKLTSPKTLTPQ